ncbi:hypothetical protein C0992_000440 [Termitomyces sp. T32_za158]|nr:hypothetical protein C0992_000440 [Termitomyces sp. T32_za158]
MESVSSSGHGPSDPQSVRSPVSTVDHDILVRIFSFLDNQPLGDDESNSGDPPIRLPSPPRLHDEAKVTGTPSAPLTSQTFTARLYRVSQVCKAFFLPAMDLLWHSMDSFVPILKLLPTMNEIAGVFMLIGDIQTEHVERFAIYGSRIRKFTLTEGDQPQIAPFALFHIASILPNIPHVVCSSAQTLSSSSASLLLTNGLKHFELTNATDTAVNVIKPFLCTLQARVPQLEHLSLRDSLGSETLSVISGYQHLLSLEFVGNIDIVIFSQIVTLPELRKLTLDVADSMPVETPRTATLIGLRRLETLHITGFGATVESFILRLEGNSLVDVGVTVQSRDSSSLDPDMISRSVRETPYPFLGRSLSALSTKWPALRSLSVNIISRPSGEVPEIVLNALRRFENLENLYLALPLRPPELMELATRFSNLITLRVEVMEDSLLDLGILNSMVNMSPRLLSLNIEFGLCEIPTDSVSSLNPHLKTLIINAKHETSVFLTVIRVGEYLDKVFPGLQRVEIEPCRGALFWKQVREVITMIQRIRRRVERGMTTKETAG